MAASASSGSGKLRSLVSMVALGPSPTPASSASALRVRASIKCNPFKVAPQSDWVLVRLEQIPEKSAGGVLLPKSAVKFERYLMGDILSVGPDLSEVEAGKKTFWTGNLYNT